LESCDLIHVDWAVVDEANSHIAPRAHGLRHESAADLRTIKANIPLHPALFISFPLEKWSKCMLLWKHPAQGVCLPRGPKSEVTLRALEDYILDDFQRLVGTAILGLVCFEQRHESCNVRRMVSIYFLVRRLYHLLLRSCSCCWLLVVVDEALWQRQRRSYDLVELHLVLSTE